MLQTEEVCSKCYDAFPSSPTIEWILLVGHLLVFLPAI